MKNIILPALLLIILFGCQNTQETEELNRSVVCKWLSEINKENYEELYAELWSDSCKHYFNSDSEALAYEDFKQLLHKLYTECPDIEHEIHEIIACDDKVFARFSGKVLHDTIMFGAPATGKEIEWNAMAIFQLSQGMIQQRWEVTDLLGMYQQLGMELRKREESD
jgi:steroid delta-isomerase-like uncharacterized protein